ncbi:hypothetical protein Tco_0322722 [Tanacetum coccineum]
MAEPTLEVYVVNDQNKLNLSITSNDINIELSKEFLVKQHKNAYHTWIDEDVMDNIAKVLEMIDLIYILGVDSHQLRMIVYIALTLLMITKPMVNKRMEKEKSPIGRNYVETNFHALAIVALQLVASELRKCHHNLLLDAF